ncbi:MAG: uroporphyrinogen-III C-methyltransferase [Bacteroidota bacterium]
MMKNLTNITLVGAGPGDPDLISLAGVKALRKAKVVLYDALVNPEILRHAEHAELIFVGKRKGYKRFEQEEINEMLLKYAHSHGHVVRLKGGDPFIFGRGSEEVQYLERFGLKCTIIPGISSVQAGPASQNIPLTQRGAAEGFWVITGTTKSRQLSQDVALAAKSNSTVVILMGMSKLSEIVQLFKAEGKGRLEIAIVQNATRENEKAVLSTINEIEREVKLQALKNPAVIVIGKVVSFAKMSNTIDQILNNKAA